MGHEKGGWMNEDQRSATRDEVKRRIAMDFQRRLRERFGDAYADEVMAEAAAIRELERNKSKGL